jgi:ribosomal protein S27AE
MSEKELIESWSDLSQEVIVGMREWRNQHPRASLREIETELDQRLARLRVRLLQDTALQSRAVDWQAAAVEEQPVCPECGERLKTSGWHQRELQSHGQTQLVLQRQYGVCPKCGLGFFPPG